MSLKLAELIKQAEELAAEEQLQLIAYLAQKLSTTTQISLQESESDSQDQKEKTTGQSLLELFSSITEGITEEEVAKLPTDGAEQHDHYIYGTPKRQP